MRYNQNIETTETLFSISRSKDPFVKSLGSVTQSVCIVSFFLLLSLFVLQGSQQFALAQPDQAPSLSQAANPNEDVIKGIHLLYNRRFDEAEVIFRKVIAEFPDKPIGYFYSAMVMWSRYAAGFCSAEIVNEYLKRVDRTIDVAKTHIEDSNSPDYYDFFYMGGALGFKGRFNLSEGNWLSAFLLATESIEALKTSLRMHPNNRDVLLGIGIFDYYTANLSGVLKFLSYLLIHKGNKEEGIKKLRLAAKEAIYSETEAKNTLLHIYLFFEQDYLNALELAYELAAEYEHNPRFKVLEGVCYIRLGNETQFRQTVRYFRQRSLQANPEYDARLWARRALYLESIHDLFHSRYAEARIKVEEILNHADPEHDPAMIAWPLLKMGISYDLEDNRQEAIKYYNQILCLKNASGAQFLAKKYLDNQVRKKDPFIGY